MYSDSFTIIHLMNTKYIVPSSTSKYLTSNVSLTLEIKLKSQATSRMFFSTYKIESVIPKTPMQFHQFFELNFFWTLYREDVTAAAAQSSSTTDGDAIRGQFLKQQGGWGSRRGSTETSGAQTKEHAAVYVCVCMCAAAWLDANNPSPWQHSSGFVRGLTQMTGLIGGHGLGK